MNSNKPTVYKVLLVTGEIDSHFHGNGGDISLNKPLSAVFEFCDNYQADKSDIDNIGYNYGQQGQS